MKLKIDFVTNSSSTSFVVMGSYLDLESISDKIIEDVSEKEGIEIDALKQDPREIMESLLFKSDLSFSFGPDGYYDYSGLMVGINYGNMKENETLSQFRERCRTLIKERTGIDCNPKHIQVCWSDR